MNIASQNMQAMSTGMTYESLIEGFLLPGETIDTFASMLDYNSAVVSKMLANGDDSGKTELLPGGKAVLTNKRVLLISCQPNVVADFSTGDFIVPGHWMFGYGLSYAVANSVAYTSIPLTNFRSLEMVVQTSCSATTRVQKAGRACCLTKFFMDMTFGLGEMCGCEHPHIVTPAFAESKNLRHFKLDYAGESRSFLKFHDYCSCSASWFYITSCRSMGRGQQVANYHQHPPQYSDTKHPKMGDTSAKQMPLDIGLGNDVDDGWSVMGTVASPNLARRILLNMGMRFSYTCVRDQS